MNSISPKSSFALLGMGIHTKQKPLKIMVIGQSGVGKTALVVRFITNRFIGEYDPTLEKIYTFNTQIDKEVVPFEILDAGQHPHETEYQTLEANIRWADAFVLMYSVTDKCSFDEINRLKFLINYNKRKRKLGSSNYKEGMQEVPVVLVGNKTDMTPERMVSIEEGQKRSKEISCCCFHEVSVRESAEQVWSVFQDVCRFWRVFNKFPKLKRSSSDVQTETLSPDTMCSFAESRKKSTDKDSEVNGHEDIYCNDCNGNNASSSTDTPFRGRASTDGTILTRPRRWRYPPPGSIATHPSRVERRMSISMRGSNASY